MVVDQVKAKYIVDSSKDKKSNFSAEISSKNRFSIGMEKIFVKDSWKSKNR